MKKYTDNDEDPAMDLHAIMRQDSWKNTNSSSMKREMMNRVRSSSWDGDDNVFQTDRKKSQNLSVEHQGDAETNLRHQTVQTYEFRINDGMGNTQPIHNSSENGTNLFFPTTQLSTHPNEGERKSWVSADQANLLRPQNQNIAEGSPSGRKSNPMGPHKLNVKDDVRKDNIGISEVERIDSEEGSQLSDSRASPQLNNELKIGNNTPSTGKNKVFKQSKTVMFEDYPGRDLNPNDILLETDKIVSDPAVNPKKIIVNKSTDTSMIKGEGDPAAALTNLRYDRDFFHKHIMNRTGIPTIIAKKIEATGPLNLNEFASTPAQIEGFTDRTKSMNVHLLKELASIEKQKVLKMKVEQFVLLFNKNADQGIAYLVSSGLVADHDPVKIASVMLVTEGLNKETIGDYLGSYKEKNKNVLRAYCQLLDFRNLEFDHALRLLLSRFKLPGEAQQIERIVNIFAVVYHADNPKVFPDEDTPFILAYSLLMLNTDAHSSMVPQKNKMTKQQFVENNIRVSKTLTREYLGRMYDRVTKQKFETKADYIETIYNRLHEGNLDIQGVSLKNHLDLAKELMAGARFVKYGRKGKGHERKVYINEREDAIEWCSLTKASDKPRRMPFAEIRDVLGGHNTTEILVKNKVPSEFDSLVLSIISKNRTLDLKAPNVETRVKWERYFRFILLQRKDKNKELKNTEGEQKRQAEKEKLSEIWKVDILPNWESHWDYEKRKPKNVEQLYDPKSKNKKTAKKGSGRQQGSIWNIFRRKKPVKYKRYLEKSSLKNNDQDQEEVEEEEEEETEVDLLIKNKDLMLVGLWKKGIPHWLRRTLWPIAIGNQLEVTEQLYEVLLSQARIFLEQAQLSKSAVFESFKRMETDLEELFSTFPEMKDRKEALVNILEAFLFYRPDVGYVKGMSRLVMLLLLYCDEYQAFSCFINLTHSHHFISFFRGIMREIEWKIRFFNKVFEEELPHLFAHFKALDLSSEMFILEWFLSLFSTALYDHEIVARIWDCFLMEGEIVAMKTGVAILKYFELELKMKTFDGAVKFLKELPRDIDEEQLFRYIEKVNVSYQDYQEELKQQKVAEINSKVHLALLEN